MKGICPGHVLHICFVYKLQWKRALTMDMLGTVHKWKPNVTDMIWRCLGTAIAMPNTMETRAQEPWSDYRLQLVFHGQGKQKQSAKHAKKRPNKGWSRTRSERGPNEVPNEVKNYPGQTLTQILELEDFRLQLTVDSLHSLHSVYYPFMFESWPMLIDKEPRKKRAPHGTHSSKSKDNIHD